ncbi:MAG: acetylxylan esterase [Clostridiaceae bacterium]|nr:acetylxylan esterase [Clostridiaceae bacterium]
MVQQYDMPLEQLRVYKPELTRQPDFDDFWNKSLEKLAGVPLGYKLTPYEYPVKGIKVFRISFNGFENANIDGWLSLPEGSDTYPGLLLLHGYNWAADGHLHEVVNWALKGYVSLQMFVRGQHGRSVDNVISSEGYHAGWMTKGIQSPEEYYYRAVYMDTVRALEVLSTMPQVDKTKIGVTGGSQGGGLSLAAAALSNIPVVVAADYPYLSDFERAIDLAPSGPYLEINEYFRRYSDPEIEVQAKKTLSYFDIMNLASKIKCHTWVSVGLIDDITPPSTVFAAYNHMECSKEIAVFRYFGHEYIPGAVVPKLKLLMDYLQK